MSILIGTDEAGYGPNLGPLVITATAWELPSGVAPQDLWELLHSALTKKPGRGDSRLHVGDSKQVYSAGRSIAPLELAVLSLLKNAKLAANSVGTLGASVGSNTFEADYAEICGDLVADRNLPVACDHADVEMGAQSLGATLRQADVRLLAVKSCIMFAPEFNRGVQATGSKGKVLSAATLKLVREMCDLAGAAPAGWVVCDKHGGRNRYDDIISEAFDDEFVFRLEESGPSSRYRVGKLEFCFRTKAEELLPVAFASMVSKYVREVVMMQFNSFWQHHVPELKPTKGYPVDAKRFQEEIATKAEELGIAMSNIWRCR